MYPSRRETVWHGQRSQRSAALSSVRALHHRLQRLRNDATLQRDQRSQDPRRAQCLWGRLPQPHLLQCRSWNLHPAGELRINWLCCKQIYISIESIFMCTYLPRERETERDTCSIYYVGVEGASWHQYVCWPVFTLQRVPAIRHKDISKMSKLNFSLVSFVVWLAAPSWSRSDHHRPVWREALLMHSADHRPMAVVRLHRRGRATVGAGKRTTSTHKHLVVVATKLLPSRPPPTPW